MTFDSTKEEYFPRGGFGGEIKKKRNFVVKYHSFNYVCASRSHAQFLILLLLLFVTV